MLTPDITKEKAQVKQSKRRIVPALSFCMVDSATEAEIQRRLDNAFDILFTEVFKNNVDKSI